MSKRIFLDVETNDIKVGQICQLSYIIEDGLDYEAKNFFLDVDYMTKGAENAHGFSIEKLKVLSEGQRFKDIFEELLNDLKGSILICHNVSFDYYGFIKKELERLHVLPMEVLDEYLNLKTFCTMKYFTSICRIPSNYKNGGYKYPRLSELMNFLDIKPKTVLTFAKLYFRSDNITFHDARFDTTGLYLCYKEGIDKGYINVKG